MIKKQMPSYLAMIMFFLIILSTTVVYSSSILESTDEELSFTSIEEEILSSPDYLMETMEPLKTFEDDKVYALQAVSKDYVEYLYEESQKPRTITISAVGDCTLGTDENFGYKNSFLDVYHSNGDDLDFFFRNVKSYFEEDDLTIANLETTLTEATKKRDKKFRFRGYPIFSEILSRSSIEAVSLANNHSYDYFRKGLLDTKENLASSGVTYFDEEVAIYEKSNIKIGLVGYNSWSVNTTIKNKVSESIKSLKDQGCELIIVSFHWGIEYSFYPEQYQKSLGRHAIDEGADLVLGHHPHVLQGIESYKGKHIVYSLGNFSFGGNSNPRDKDTMIYQQTFYFQKNTLLDTIDINLIPCSLTSIKGRNNYQPIPLTDTDYSRVIERINTYSRDLNFYYDDESRAILCMTDS